MQQVAGGDRCAAVVTMSDAAVALPESTVVLPESAPDTELDERDAEPRTPMKRLGSTRKLAAFNKIRSGVGEHVRVLEARCEAATGAAAELAEYCRRRADLEHEYARALDKLARAQRHRYNEHKLKREPWSSGGAWAGWAAAVEGTRLLARDHAALADLYGGPLAARLARASEDAQRLHRKCRDIVLERHEEVGAVLGEAAAAGKASGEAGAAWRTAADKLRAARDARDTYHVLAQNNNKHLKKLKALDKQLDKRLSRYSSARAAALRARAEYALALAAANATLQRYYLDDVPDIIACMEVGFSSVVGRCVCLAGAAESGRASALHAVGRALRHAADDVSATHPSAPRDQPPSLPYRGITPDQQDSEMRSLCGEEALSEDEVSAAASRELMSRVAQLEGGARALRAECAEHAKTLRAAEAELLKQMEGGEEAWDVSRVFGAEGDGAGAVPRDVPPDPARRDQEDYYLAKFRAYMSCAGRVARLDGKVGAGRARLASDAGLAPPPAPTVPASPRGGSPPPRDRFTAPPRADALPAVLTSCVRVIATYGLHHQGIFRVSGSQVEMASLRAAFERGADPLAEVRDATDINSVCGLLKLWVREVRPPLVPPPLQLRLAAACASAGAPSAVVGAARQVLRDLPAGSALALRYLFAFLAHLAAHKRHNMMDAWNLAVCLGPSLLPAAAAPPHAAAPAADHVARQNLVNELVKLTILHHRDIFPQHVAPHTLFVPPQPYLPAAVGEEAENGARVDARDERDSRDRELYEDEDEDKEEDEDEDDEGEGEGEDEDEDEAVSSESDPSAPEQRDERDERTERTEPTERAAPDYQHRMANAAADVSREPGAPSAPHASPAHPAHPAPLCRRLETTPDLVLDLPARATSPPRAETSPPADADASSPPRSPQPPDPADPADTFVHNRDTLKKRHATRHTGNVMGGESPEGVAGVGGRVTARVRAQFADLTLTGGSKPVPPPPPARPALLRRPTPHPHHARSAPLVPLAAPAPPASAVPPATDERPPN